MAFRECSRFIGSFCQRRDSTGKAVDLSRREEGGPVSFLQLRLLVSRRYYSCEICPLSTLRNAPSHLLYISVDLINSSCRRALLPCVPPSKTLRGERDTVLISESSPLRQSISNIEGCRETLVNYVDAGRLLFHAGRTTLTLICLPQAVKKAHVQVCSFS